MAENSTARDFSRERSLAAAISWFTAVGIALLAYPFLLDAFHRVVVVQTGRSTSSTMGLAALCLGAIFAVPTLALLAAIRLAAHRAEDGRRRRILRFYYISVAAPTAYTLLGVVLYMLRSPVPDEAVWVVVWLAFIAWTMAWPTRETRRTSPAKLSAKLRIAHGTNAAILVLYVLFHLTNHLTGLVGPDTHAAVMKIGRSVYRAPVIEPLLVILFLFQVGSGLRLAWPWTTRPAEPSRAFQVASGLYLSLFILGHMNSVFIFARTYLGIDTGWGFATGAPSGIIHDGWNIRLLTHYWLGVFFVLSHLAAGVRGIFLAHGVDREVVSRLWAASLIASALGASLILAGMCGIRLGGFA
jgi:hypothetical protein